ncbi:hypothetical protein LX64_04174 [Chitinophaga skermanii]|uniref:Phage tail tube protein FII n=1 Tax=Chitinophaga skermanii TaxID=331697 RepID=A0A327Q9I2_9BACT|nr:phage major tail tube protein [Chitinophaga skermanii]RAJ00468.1 hypothetical protein LX64_04174 [Chitinophaga skermanii]
MNITVNKVTNANIFLDGVGYIGNAEEISLPDVQPKLVDHKGLGFIGEIELPAGGIQKMSAKIKWNAIYDSVMLKSYNFYTACRIMVRTSIETWEGGSRVAQRPCVIVIVGTWKKTGGLTFKPQDNVELETEISVTSYRLEIDNEEIVNIDVLTNKHRINGIDQNALYRENLGI